MASPTSPPTGTNWTIAATLDFRGTPIPINVSDLKNFVFQLSAPVELGTLDDFVDWLHDDLHLPITSQDIANLETDIPKELDKLAELFQAFMSAPISITVLVINFKQKTYAFGATMNFVSGGGSPSFTLFDGLSLSSIGVLVTHTDKTTSP